MRIIYNCFGGSHSSVTAAAIHLQLLPETRIAAAKEFLSLPYYDAQVAADHGRIRFIGWDKDGNEIYISSKRNLRGNYGKIMDAVRRLIGAEDEKIIFIDTMPYVNIWMMIGGFLSRRWGWSDVGRAIVIYGTRQSYLRFCHLVQLVKAGLKQ